MDLGLSPVLCGFRMDSITGCLLCRPGYADCQESQLWFLADCLLSKDHGDFDRACSCLCVELVCFRFLFLNSLGKKKKKKRRWWWSWNHPLLTAYVIGLLILQLILIKRNSLMFPVFRFFCLPVFLSLIISISNTMVSFMVYSSSPWFSPENNPHSSIVASRLPFYYV